MSHFDLDLEELLSYRSRSEEPADFDAFWSRTLAEASTHAVDARFARVDLPLTGVEVYDVDFAGYGGHRIKGWLVLPAGATAPLPAVVQYLGYQNGRGLPHSHLLWANAGYAHLVMDNRGQGGSGAGGDTGDPVGTASPARSGYLTQGVEDPETFYYRRLYVDAVRAVAAVRSHPLVDAGRVAVCGESQGGALAVAVGGLVGDLAAVMPDVPFLSDFPRAAEIAERLPYQEIGLYLRARRDERERLFRTLAHFDGVHLAARHRAPALWSVALEDRTCPPSTVFAGYNACAAEDKQIEIHHFNDHEGGQAYQQRLQLRWLAERLRPGAGGENL